MNARLAPAPRSGARRRGFAAAALSALLLALSGCAGYRAGLGGDLPFSSVHVALASDATFTPGSRVLLSRFVAGELASSGRVTLASGPSTADTVVELQLVSTQRQRAVGAVPDAGRSAKLETDLVARVTVRHADGRVLVDDREIAIRREVFPGNSQTEAEAATLPTSLHALAREITAGLLSAW